MRTLLIAAALSIVCLSGSANAVTERKTAESAVPERSQTNSIRIAQNRRRDGRNGRDSIVEGCGVRDALCVANRLLRQMERQVGGQRRRQIDELGKLMQRACGAQPKDVVCAGDFVSRALAVATGSGGAPGPIVRERRRQPGGRPRPRSRVGGLSCQQRQGYPGLFPVRTSDNRSFGSRGFAANRGVDGCDYAIRNWNSYYAIVCTNHSTHGNRQIIAQNIADASVYGSGFRSLRACVASVAGIRRGAICARQPGAGSVRIMNIANRAFRGPSFPSLDRCLVALHNR